MATEKTQEAAAPGAASYRQKSPDVEARQLIDDLRNHTAIAAWIESAGVEVLIPFAEPCLYVETTEGRERAGIGDWIVKFPAGTFRVLSPDKFTAAFEPVDEAGVAMIRAERLRQVAVEGYDAEQADGDLIRAAVAYAKAAVGATEEHTTAWWPWAVADFKPGPKPLDSLVKAGALIAAEIDRIVAEGSHRG